MNLFGHVGHSRVPVYRDSLDNPIGMVHIKDAIAWATSCGGKPGAQEDCVDGVQCGDLRAALKTTIESAKLVREALFVPPSMPALALLAKMKSKKIYLAIVVDEFGGTDGLATFQDVVEEIMGDIADEHDEIEAHPIGRENEAFIASAKTPIEDVEQVLGMSFTSAGVPDDVETLGGLILATVGRVPKRGQVIPHPSGVTFEILEAGPRRLHTVRISKQRALGAPERPRLLPAPDEQQLLPAPNGDGALKGARAA